MKKLLSLAFAIMMIAWISAQEQANVVVFDETTHDFGVIKEEDGRVTTVFNFTNTTQGPLTITNVRASCGCTTPAWNKEPIAPEGQGQITVSYNAKGRPGAFHKSVTITLSNGNETFTYYVYIKGKVTPAEQQPAQTSPVVIEAKPAVK